jgi:hypothetical protein
MARTYAAHFTPGLSCEVRECRATSRLLWPVNGIHVRACTPAHARQAAAEIEEFDRWLAALPQEPEA